MALIPLVPETRKVDVGKLSSFGNLLVRKVTWFVLTTTSAFLILYRAFRADHTTRIVYIYSRLPRTHSLSHFHLQRQYTLSLSILTYRDNTHSHSPTFWLPETALSLHLVTQLNTRKMGAYIFCNLFFFSCPAFSVRLLTASNTASEISSNPERDNQPTWEKTRSSKHTLLYFCILVLFTNPSARAGFDTRSIFKRSLTGLNSEFSFSELLQQGWRT